MIMLAPALRSACQSEYRVGLKHLHQATTDMFIVFVGEYLVMLLTFCSTGRGSTYTSAGKHLAPARNVALLVRQLVAHKIVHRQLDRFLGSDAHQLRHQTTVQPQEAFVPDDLRRAQESAGRSPF